MGGGGGGGGSGSGGGGGGGGDGDLVRGGDGGDHLVFDWRLSRQSADLEDPRFVDCWMTDGVSLVGRIPHGCSRSIEDVRQFLTEQEPVIFRQEEEAAEAGMGYMMGALVL